MQMLSGWLARHFPTMKVPLGNLTMLLTHDQTITARHFQDERDGIRASAATVRFAHALLSAQKALADGLSGWTFPCSPWWPVTTSWPAAAPRRWRAVRPMACSTTIFIRPTTTRINELNREVIFAAILDWMEKLLAPAPA